MGGLFAKLRHRKIRGGTAPEGSPAREVSASLDVLETALEKLATPPPPPPPPEPPPPVDRKEERKLKRKVKRLEDRSLKDREQIRTLKQELKKRAETLEKQAAAADLREAELTDRIRKMSEDLDSGTALLEQAMAEMEKRKQPAPVVVKPAIREAVVTEAEAQKRVTAALAEATAAHRKQEASLRSALDKEQSSERRQAEDRAREIADLEEKLRAALLTGRKLQLRNEEQATRYTTDRAHFAACRKRARDGVRSLERELPHDWHMKMADGSVCGPVDMGTLYDWASNCRIGPGHEVSPDGRSWVEAQTVADLRMLWTIELVDGSVYGPLNVCAITHLLEEGVAAATAKVTHVKTGRCLTANALGSEQLEEARAGLARLAGETRRMRDGFLGAIDVCRNVLTGGSQPPERKATKAPPKLLQRRITGEAS